MNEDMEIENDPFKGRIVASAIILAVVAATTLWYLLAGRPGSESPSSSPTAISSEAPAPGENNDGGIAIPGEGQANVIPVPGQQDNNTVFIPVTNESGEVASGRDELVHVSPTSQTGAKTNGVVAMVVLSMFFSLLGFKLAKSA